MDSVKQNTNPVSLGGLVLQQAQRPEGERPQLWHYFWVVRQRFWLLIVCPLVACSWAFFAAMGKPPIYRATTRLLIGREGTPANVAEQGDLSGFGNEERYLQTQYTILEGKQLALSVIDVLDLTRDPEFLPDPETKSVGLLTRLKEWIRSSIPTAKAPSGPEAASEAAPHSLKPRDIVPAVIARLDVDPVKMTRLVDVSFLARDPKTAARIANALADAYVEQELQRDMEAIEQALGYLREQQAEFQRKVEESEEQLLQYKRQEKLVALESRQQIQADKLSALNAALSSARVERVRAESKYEGIKDAKVRGERLDGIGKFAESSQVNTVGRSYLRLVTEQRRLAQTLGPEHQKMVELAARLEETRSLLDAEIRLAVASAKAALDAVRSEEMHLGKILDDHKEQTIDLEEKTIRFNVMKREADSNQQLFDLLLTKAKETSLAGQVLHKNIKVISPADVPLSPEPTRGGRRLTMAAVMGLMAALALAFLLDHLDQSVRSAEELQNFIGVSFLGTVGHVDYQSRSEEWAAYQICVQQAKSLAAESFRTIRTNLVFALRDIGARSLIVTSSVPQEGKSVVAANLAVSVAQSGKRVLLVDADMRRPVVHRAFQIENSPGLSSYLVNEAEMEEIVSESSVANLSLVSAGPIPPNQAELLGDDAMARLLSWGAEEYDLTIYDCPPVLSVSDPLVLGGQTGTAVYVIRSGVTSRGVVKRCVQQLRDLNVHILGAIMNDIDETRSAYYYGDGHYRYGYRGKYYQAYGDEGQSAVAREPAGVGEREA